MHCLSVGLPCQCYIFYKLIILSYIHLMLILYIIVYSVNICIIDSFYIAWLFLLTPASAVIMNSMLHSLYWSIHTKDESKRGTAFAFILGVN